MLFFKEEKSRVHSPTVIINNTQQSPTLISNMIKNRRKQEDNDQLEEYWDHILKDDRESNKPVLNIMRNNSSRLVERNDVWNKVKEQKL